MKIDLSPYQVRPLEARDIPAVMSVDRLAFADPWPESAYIQELYFNPNAHYFILQLMQPSHKRWQWGKRASRADHILGFTGMRVEMGKGHISTLAIRPEWRGRGLGELLLLTALIQAVEDQAHSVTLEVRISNQVAQALYTKYGFTTISRLYQYYSDHEDAYLMRTGPLDLDYQRYLGAQYHKILKRLQQQAPEFEVVS